MGAKQVPSSVMESTVDTKALAAASFMSFRSMTVRVAARTSYLISQMGYGGVMLVDRLLERAVSPFTLAVAVGASHCLA